NTSPLSIIQIACDCIIIVVLLSETPTSKNQRLVFKSFEKTANCNRSGKQAAECESWTRRPVSCLGVHYVRCSCHLFPMAGPREVSFALDTSSADLDCSFMSATSR